MKKEEKVLREEMEATIYNLIEKLKNVKAGSEEHSRIIEDISKLSKAYEDDYRTEFEMYNQSVKIDNEKELHEKELEIKKDYNRKDLETRKVQIHLEELRHKRVKADTIFTVASFGLMTYGACRYERLGYLIPGKPLKFVDVIPKFIKL